MRSTVEVHPVALLSVDEDGVHAGLVYITPEAFPVVRDSIHIPISTEGGIDNGIEDALERTATWLRSAILRNNLPLDIPLTHVLSPYWTTSKVSARSIQRGLPFAPSPVAVGVLVEEELMDAPKALECHATGCLLDNAPLHEFREDRVGHHFQTTLITSHAHERRGEWLLKALEKIFGIGGRTHYTSTLVLFSALRDIYGEQEGFALAEVSDKETRLSISTSHGLAHIENELPGSARAVLAIANALSVSRREAESLLSLYSRGMLSPRSGEFRRVAEILDRYSKVWNERVESVLRERLGGNEPSHLFISSSTERLPWLKQELLRHSGHHATPLSDKLFAPHTDAHAPSTDPLLLSGAMFMAKLWALK